MWKLFVSLFLLMAVGGGIFREYRNRIWDNVGRFTIIEFNKGEVFVRSVDPISKEAVSVKLPKDLQIDTVSGRGVWRVEVLPDLASKNGWKWAGDSEANFLGISYSGLKSELSLWDKFNWWLLTKNVGWVEVPLEETAFVSESLARDDEKVLGLDSKWGRKAREYFAAMDLSKKEREIVIINTTSTAGLGAYAARVIDSSGIRVVMVKSRTENTLDKCQLKINSSSKDSKTLRFLENIFGCQILMTDENEVGDVELLLGTDYGKFVFGE